MVPGGPVGRGGLPFDRGQSTAHCAGWSRVVDKDRTRGLLARLLGTDTLLVVIDVKTVELYRSPGRCGSQSDGLGRQDAPEAEHVFGPIRIRTVGDQSGPSV